MSEAFGTVVIRAPAQIISHLCKDDELVPWNAISKLLDYAGVDLTSGQFTSSFFSEDSEFFHEGIESAGESAVFTIFGEEWMYLLEALTKQGRNIEVYGEIEHENGSIGFFALNGRGKSFSQRIDFEDDSEDEDDVRDLWEQLIPTDLVEFFERKEDQEHDDDAQEESDRNSIEEYLTSTIHSPKYPGHVVVHRQIYMHPDYDRSKLQRAVQNGGQLVNPAKCIGGRFLRSLLNLVITNPEIESYSHRKQVVEDILSLNLLDLDEEYAGYGTEVGTPLYLAADHGLYEIVAILLDHVSDKNPIHPQQSATALDVARSKKHITPEDGRDYTKVIELLELAN